MKSTLQLSAVVLVSLKLGFSLVHTHDHDGSEALDESPGSILSSEPKPLGKHRHPTSTICLTHISPCVSRSWRSLRSCLAPLLPPLFTQQASLSLVLTSPTVIGAISGTASARSTQVSLIPYPTSLIPCRLFNIYRANKSIIYPSTSGRSSSRTLFDIIFLGAYSGDKIKNLLRGGCSDSGTSSLRSTGSGMDRDGGSGGSEGDDDGGKGGECACGAGHLARSSPGEGGDSEIGGDGDGVVMVRSLSTSASGGRDMKVWGRTVILAPIVMSVGGGGITGSVPELCALPPPPHHPQSLIHLAVKP
ncbi:hypothetical protein Tco_0669393 [Tanacetum coccineum]